MELHIINTGMFKLDGGAMFGVVPKTIWQKTNPADEHNMCTWAMRCLLVEDGNRLILIDTGIGNKQSEKFFSHYYLHGDDSLDASLQAKGFHRNDITDVFLTHLHFDHCGGAIERNSAGEGYRPAFPNAVYWSCERHWEWATKPNAREKASFLSENILPLQESGQLRFIDRHSTFGPTPLGFDVLFVDGHTESMMLPHIPYKGKTVVFMADLLPSAGHIPLPYVMGYDTRPLITLEEKGQFLNKAANEEYVILFEHDSINECATLVNTEKGVRAGNLFHFRECFG
ncbi:MAG: MBL fold metallo-hydrolase [Flavobacteriales bacterium]|jgi:glyoxylase-like metal-dependent hydrolase (beta-lactamase superfamily II)